MKTKRDKGLERLSYLALLSFQGTRPKYTAFLSSLRPFPAAKHTLLSLQEVKSPSPKHGALPSVLPSLRSIAAAPTAPGPLPDSPTYTGGQGSLHPSRAGAAWMAVTTVRGPRSWHFPAHPRGRHPFSTSPASASTYGLERGSPRETRAARVPARRRGSSPREPSFLPPGSGRPALSREKVRRETLRHRGTNQSAGPGRAAAGGVREEWRGEKDNKVRTGER